MKLTISNLFWHHRYLYHLTNLTNSTQLQELKNQNELGISGYVLNVLHGIGSKDLTCKSPSIVIDISVVTSSGAVYLA